MVKKNIQDKKQMKKYFSFIIYNYCFLSINMIEKLIDFSDINFNTIHYLLINFITNIYILCLTNNIQLDKIKAIIEEGCLIIFDYLTISREELSNTNTYKIKYNDAIHFAYKKILMRINIITKEEGSIINNLKPMNTTKNLALVIDGINLIKNIFCCLFKLQFTTNANKILKYIDISYYQYIISEIKKHTAIHVNADLILCKKIDKLHKQLSSILFYNVDIIEHFIINLIPNILSFIKSSNFSQYIYNMYIGYLTEYYCKLKPNSMTLTTDGLPYASHYSDLTTFIIIILLLQQYHHHTMDILQLPHTALIDKYYIILQNINYEQDCEKIFKIPFNQLTINHLFITENYKQLFI